MVYILRNSPLIIDKIVHTEITLASFKSVQRIIFYFIQEESAARTDVEKPTFGTSNVILKCSKLVY